MQFKSSDKINYYRQIRKLEESIVKHLGHNNQDAFTFYILT